MTQGQNPPQPKSSLNDDLGRMDNAWEWIAPFLPLLAGAGAVWLHPSVDVGNGWVGVFLSTLAFSLGCALCVGLLNGSGLTGWPLALSVALCFLASISLAAVIGVGMLELGSVMDNAPAQNPIGFVIGVVITAMLAFGVGGAILGGLAGAGVGSIAAKHIRRHRV